MARINDGELFLEIEGATEVQLQRGLSAARQYIARSGVYVDDAMRSAALCEQESAWEAGGGELPGEPSDQDYENAEIVDEAWAAALAAAGFNSGTLGLLPPDQQTRNRPVVRDLFEMVS